MDFKLHPINKHAPKKLSSASFVNVPTQKGKSCVGMPFDIR